MIEKDYPVLLRFDYKSNLQLILDVSYKDGFYFEKYIVMCSNESGYYNELFSSILESEALSKYESFCKMHRESYK